MLLNAVYSEARVNDAASILASSQETVTVIQPFLAERKCARAARHIT